jgi:hypothetical protein
MHNSMGTGDPSLRLKNGSAQDDAVRETTLFKLSHYPRIRRETTIRPVVYN